MSSKKQKERKKNKRKELVKQKLLRRRNAIREHSKLEKELEELKRSQEDKIVPYRKKIDDTES